MDDKYKDTDSFIASRKMLESAGITLRKMDPISIEVNGEK
jgi:hypothetical protein